MKYYMPSNGDEGSRFTDKWCERCRNERQYRATEDGQYACLLLLRAYYGEQPEEWVYREDGTPTCTAFVDENREEWEDDPRQLRLPFDEPDEEVVEPSK